MKLSEHFSDAVLYGLQKLPSLSFWVVLVVALEFAGSTEVLTVGHLANIITIAALLAVCISSIRFMWCIHKDGELTP